jgi:hypothetical protein
MKVSNQNQINDMGLEIHSRTMSTTVPTDNPIDNLIPFLILQEEKERLKFQVVSNLGREHTSEAVPGISRW